LYCELNGFNLCGSISIVISFSSGHFSTPQLVSSPESPPFVFPASLILSQSFPSLEFPILSSRHLLLRAVHPSFLLLPKFSRDQPKGASTPVAQGNSPSFKLRLCQLAAAVSVRAILSIFFPMTRREPSTALFASNFPDTPSPLFPGFIPLRSRALFVLLPPTWGFVSPFSWRKLTRFHRFLSEFTFFPPVLDIDSNLLRRNDFQPPFPLPDCVKGVSEVSPCTIPLSVGHTHFLGSLVSG